MIDCLEIKDLDVQKTTVECRIQKVRQMGEISKTGQDKAGLSPGIRMQVNRINYWG